METLLLPGMDGTGRLFEPLLPRLAPRLGARVVEYPRDRPRSYAQLLDDIEVPDGPFALIGESFSGPLAIRLAARHAERVRALVLVATFVRSPSVLAGAMSGLGSLLFRLPPPDFALRAALVGMDATEQELRSVREAIVSVHPRVMAARLAEIAAVDARRELGACTMPVLYLAGARDRVVGASVMRAMQALHPGMDARVLDAPHLVLQRRPAEAAECIHEFLTRAR